jgi:predicted nuclease of restriction endonuclease-like RecB superfamily
MLTADLLRVRSRKGVLHPQYVDESEAVVEAARELVQVYRDGVGHPRAEITDAVERIVGHGTDFLLWRGFAKLLDDRSTFETVAPVEPRDLRREVFERAFAGSPVDSSRRDAILAAVAEEHDVAAAEVSAALYADLDERQRLVEFDDLEPEALVRRYNVALAQAVLYRATRLVFWLRNPNPNRLRYLFSALKFHGLMHRATEDDESLRVEVDGPASLFKLSRKYGLQMAVFLPALLLLDDWKFEAELDWKGKDRVLRLSSDDGLESHYRARGQWQTDEEKWFEERFGTTDTEWSLTRRGTVVELRDGEVIVADYVLESPDGDEVVAEIVTFWRSAYLRRRIEMLDAIDRPFVLIVSERLKADRAALEVDLPLEVVFYKGVILPKKVIAAAEAALR